MKTNKNLFWIIGIIILISVLDKPEPQTVASECFEKEDCWRPPIADYCSVNYDCIQGKCYSNDVLCPEVCNSGKDEDLDGYTDCDDDDCWDSPTCHCSIMEFNNCITGMCYCESGIPRWFITSESNYCWCVG